MWQEARITVLVLCTPSGYMASKYDARFDELFPRMKQISPRHEIMTDGQTNNVTIIWLLRDSYDGPSYAYGYLANTENKTHKNKNFPFYSMQHCSLVK